MLLLAIKKCQINNAVYAKIYVMLELGIRVRIWIRNYKNVFVLRVGTLAGLKPNKQMKSVLELQ